MTILKITPDSNCKACHGYGEVYDSVGWRGTTVSMPSLCDCVLEQIPEDDEDSEIDIVPNNTPTKKSKRENVYEKHADLWNNQ